MLFWGNWTVGNGVTTYADKYLQDNFTFWLGLASFWTFFVCVVVAETSYRCINKKVHREIKTPEVGKVSPYNRKVQIEALSSEDIDKRVYAGEQLMVFDNLVLKLSGFDEMHPGGKFNLLRNMGRDISKFFYGGYSLVNPNNKPGKTFTHSIASLSTAKGLITGVLQGQEQVEDHEFRVADFNKVTDDTSTFIFEEVNKAEVPNLRLWYTDKQMIGRHFLVNSKAQPSVKRHYTICASMHPQVEKSLTEIAQSVIKGDQPGKLDDIFAGKNQDKVVLTLKNYNTKIGAAT